MTHTISQDTQINLSIFLEIDLLYKGTYNCLNLSKAIVHLYCKNETSEGSIILVDSFLF